MIRTHSLRRARGQKYRIMPENRKNRKKTDNTPLPSGISDNKFNTMTKKYRHLLFDLDGTLTDPMEGITRSVQHALRISVSK